MKTPRKSTPSAPRQARFKALDLMESGASNAAIIRATGLDAERVLSIRADYRAFQERADRLKQVKTESGSSSEEPV